MKKNITFAKTFIHRRLDIVLPLVIKTQNVKYKIVIILYTHK
jgi:hypothetical protein